ncbi:hypothetical protein TcasGA2_TC006682 [Tribolium castaneum]|uniref:Uncharacterized protein n=1 Tax=Tribolium castaneum TaxID=7070 RepID=D6WYG1_TRICA|nr:hypothetical protein TcasGA2_TC006682 [Tribolium castaneum]
MDISKVSSKSEPHVRISPRLLVLVRVHALSFWVIFSDLSAENRQDFRLFSPTRSRDGLVQTRRRFRCGLCENEENCAKCLWANCKVMK